MFSFDDKTLRNLDIYENQKNVQKNIDQSNPLIKSAKNPPSII